MIWKPFSLRVSCSFHCLQENWLMTGKWHRSGRMENRSSPASRVRSFRFLRWSANLLRHIHRAVLSRFRRVQLCATPWMEPTRLLCPWDPPGKKMEWVAISSPGNLLNQGIKPGSASQVNSLLFELPGKLSLYVSCLNITCFLKVWFTGKRMNFNFPLTITTFIYRSTDMLGILIF